MNGEESWKRRVFGFPMERVVNVPVPREGRVWVLVRGVDGGMASVLTVKRLRGWMRDR